MNQDFDPERSGKKQSKPNQDFSGIELPKLETPILTYVNNFFVKKNNQYVFTINEVEYSEISLTVKDWDLFESSLSKLEAKFSDLKPYIPLQGVGRSLNLEPVLIAKSFKSVLNSYVNSDERSQREMTFADIMAYLRRKSLGIFPISQDINYDQVSSSIKSLVDQNREEMEFVFASKGKINHPTVVLVADFHRESTEKGVGRTDLLNLHRSQKKIIERLHSSRLVNKAFREGSGSTRVTPDSRYREESLAEKTGLDLYSLELAQIENRNYIIPRVEKHDLFCEDLAALFVENLYVRDFFHSERHNVDTCVTILKDFIGSFESETRENVLSQFSQILQYTSFMITGEKAQTQSLEIKFGGVEYQLEYPVIDESRKDNSQFVDNLLHNLKLVNEYLPYLRSREIMQTLSEPVSNTTGALYLEVGGMHIPEMIIINLLRDEPLSLLVVDPYTKISFLKQHVDSLVSDLALSRARLDYMESKFLLRFCDYINYIKS